MLGRSILFSTLIAGLLVVTLGACEDKKASEEKYLRRGIALFEEHEFKKARVEFKNALRINPKTAEGWYRMGLVDEAEGNLRNAFAAFNRAVEEDSTHAAANIKIGNYHFLAEELDQAESRADKVLELDPDNADAHALNGAILLRRGEAEGAREAAQRALSIDPGNTGGLSVLAGYHLARGESELVLKMLEEGIANGADDVSILLLKARIHEKRAEIDEVVKTYERIFAAKPRVAGYRTALAKFLVQAQRLDQAEKVLRDGIAAMPTDMSMKVALIGFLEEKRGLDAAETALKEWKAADPETDAYDFVLAELYIRHNAIDRAIALLKEVVEVRGMEPAGLNAQVSLAKINFARGNQELAEKLLSAVLAEDPRNADALYVRASIAFNAGRLQEAIADLRIVTTDKPNFKAALQILAEALLREGDRELAIDTLVRAIDADPMDVTPRTRLAQLYHARGDSDAAIKQLRTVTEMKPQFPVAWESIARIEAGNRQWTEAEAALNKLRELPGQERVSTYLDGVILNGQGQTDAATGKFREVIRQDPESPLAVHAINSLISVEQERGKIETVIALLEEIAAEHPQVATVHTTLGRLYMRNERGEEAARQFDLAIAAGPKTADPFLARADGLIKEGKLEEALAVLKRGDEALPLDLRTKLMTASIQERMADYEAAIATYGDILAAAPLNHIAANNMAALIADFKYTDEEALEQARHLAERFVASDNPIFLDTLGWVCYRQGKIQQALIYLRRAAAGIDTAPQLYFHLGAALAAADQREEAKAALEKAVASATAYPGLEDARRLLANM